MAHNFTLGGKTNEELNISMLNSPRQALPEVMGKVEETHNRPGSYDYGGDYGELKINLECYFTRAGHEENLQEDIRALTDHLTDVDGKPREMSLVFPEEPNLSYTVRYDGGGLEVGRGLSDNQGEFTLTLIAVDPRAKGTRESTSKTITSSPGEIEVENNGNVKTPVVLKITNEGSSAISGIEINQEV